MRAHLRIGLPVAIMALLIGTLATEGSATSPVTHTMSPAVAARLATMPPGDMATVIVTLKDRADLTDIRARNRGVRLNKVLAVLQAKAASSQVSLRSRLATWQTQGQVGRVISLWISNSVVVTATAEVIQQLATRSDVAAVTPDEITVVPAALAPTTNQAAIHAGEMWDVGQTGQGAVVATLDSGVDGSHPDLAGRWRGGSNSWFDPYGQHPATPTDLSGHGTAVMGVMVAGDASGTSIGTAPGASWIAARVFDDSGRATVSAIHQAFQWVLDPDHDPTTNDAPQVVNASWSIGTAPSCDLSFQPDVQALRAAGILPVVSAGNFGSTSSTSTSPANYPESLSVGAVNDTGSIHYASSRGPSTCGGRARVFPDLVAPGVNVYTTDRYGFYQSLTGTSVAAPHAAGALALLLAAVPGLTADQQQQALTTTAHDLGSSGPDDVYGNGLVDVAAAYQSLGAPPPPPPPPSPDFTVSLSPGESSVVAGSSATFQVQVTPVNGFAGDVTLTLTGAPSGTNSTFAPDVVTGGTGTSSLTVTTAASLAAGSYPLTVTASSGTLSHPAVAALAVTTPPPVDSLYFSTVGNTNPPGVAGTADNADIYLWNGSTFSRSTDATGTGSIGLPTGANVDGYDRVDNTHYYLSFTDNVTIALPGPDLSVQDEDVVYYNAGTWSVFFDGTAHGMTAANQDLDAISIDNGTLYFSTVGNTNPPGAGGTADDADIYRYNGASSYTRVWDASANGPAAGANVDGYVRGDATHFHLSFSADTAVPGLGTVQDEDVVYYNTGTWSVYFDGTPKGLTSANQDVDAFDLP